MDYVCIRCSYTTNKKSSLKNHLNKGKICHTDLAYGSPTRTNLINEMLDICNYCGKSCRNKSKRERHMEECPVKNKLDFCNEIKNELKNEFKKEMNVLNENFKNELEKIKDKVDCAAHEVNSNIQKNGNTININVDRSVKLNPYDSIKVQIPIENVIEYIKDVVNNNDYINDLREVFFEIIYYYSDNPNNHVIYAYQKNKEYNIYVYKKTERFEYIDEKRFFKFLNECFNEGCILHLSSMVKNERVIKAIPKEDLTQFKKLFLEYKNNFQKYNDKCNNYIEDYMLEFQHIPEETYKKMLLDPDEKTLLMFNNFSKNQLKFLRNS